MPDQMREAVTAAYEKHTEPVDDTQAVEAAIDAAAAGVETPVVEAEKSEKVESTASEGKAPPVQTPPVKDGSEKPATDAAAPKAAAEVPAPQTPVAKPPRSWSAEAKAAWPTLPEHVKQDALRREKEISQGLELAAPARKHYESFQEVVKPFQPLFDAYGISDPLPAIRTLLTTRATLEIGTPEQKAQLLANLVHEFGVDVQQLDAQLVKKGPVKPFTPARPMPKPQLDPEMQEMLSDWRSAKTRFAEAEVAKIESLPHFHELSEDIADIIEAFHGAGKKIPIMSAYQRALAMNPDLEPAPAVPKITKSQAAAILASRNAASSITGTPRTGATPAPTDRRDQLVAAWEANRAS